MNRASKNIRSIYTVLFAVGMFSLMEWQTLPDRYTLAGAAITIGSGLYLIRRETVRAKAGLP